MGDELQRNLKLEEDKSFIVRSLSKGFFKIEFNDNRDLLKVLNNGPVLNSPVARVKVSLNIKEQLVKNRLIEFEDKSSILVKFKYERLPSFRFFCGIIIGHEIGRYQVKDKYIQRFGYDYPEKQEMELNFTLSLKASIIYNGRANNVESGKIIGGGKR
ncbi:hypothetical protein IFM89_020167 [Coptis chinensis]|uniref:Zinc knuckle CX2CX4HX4C domain-containing protein n=1 Tax=Coptis chinensis TaxID=261450 RepID=A0A835H7P0_9MAGN|nr:hypothetical protein IFM89_020167 [Coptis chinensis]